MENADRNPIPLRQTEKEGLETVRRECAGISNKTTHCNGSTFRHQRRVAGLKAIETEH